MSKPIINVETLQVFNNLTECAKTFKTSATSIHRALYRGGKVRHFQLEYLEDWLQWDPEVKSSFCLWGNVDFLNIVKEKKGENYVSV